MAKCKHNRLRTKLITKGKGPGEVQGYCTQQCKKFVTFTITQDEINAIYPRGRQ